MQPIPRYLAPDPAASKFPRFQQANETMSNEHAMRFPLAGSAMLLSQFLLFKFLAKDLVSAVLTCCFFVLGIVAFLVTLLPAINQFLPKHWNDDLIVWHVPYFHATSLKFTRSQVVASVPESFFCVWYALKKHWLANNILGIAFCIQGIEMLSLWPSKTSAILLLLEYNKSKSSADPSSSSSKQDGDTKLDKKLY